MSQKRTHIPAEVYEKWLGIPSSECPPDYYALLGIERGESDLTVIKAAADEQIRRVRPKCLKHRELGTHLLNEIARARVCLTSTLAKAEYDVALDSGSTLMFEGSTTAARIRAMQWRELDLTQTLPEMASKQGKGTTASDVEAAMPEPLEALTVPDEFAADAFPTANVKAPRSSSKHSAERVKASQQKPLKCPCCHMVTAPADHWAPLSVTLDCDGDLTSAVCRIRQRRTAFLLHVSIDAKPLGWDKRNSSPLLTRCGAALLLAIVLLAGLVLCLLVLQGVTENLAVPILILGLIGMIVVASVAWLYEPAVNSAEEAAWGLVVPWLFRNDRSVEHFDFIAGLARASASRLAATDSGNLNSRRSGTEKHLQQRTADKRRLIVQRCLSCARSLAGEGLIPHYSVGLLYHLLIADLQSLDDPEQQIPSVLEQLLKDCLSKELPMFCLDTAIAPTHVLDSFSLEASRQCLLQFVEACQERGHNANEIAALASDSNAISRWLARMSFSPAEAVAFLLCLSRTCREGLAKLDGAAVFEFTSVDQFASLREYPDLLALKHDKTVALRMSGFYFLGVRYVSKPKIFISNTKGGHLLHVGERSFFYRDFPGDLGGRVVAWAQLYFHTILPAVQEELAFELCPERLRRTRSVVITCPRCRKHFGGIIGSAAAS
jgi:hypothetical protein